MSNPFGVAHVLSREMDRLFSSGAAAELGGGFASADRSAPRAAGGRASTGHGIHPGLLHRVERGEHRPSYWAPQMEVYQRGNELVAQADLPGLTPDDVQIEVEGGVLTVAGERRQAAEDQHDGFYRSERSYGAFSRSIVLPDGIDENRVTARFEHGVLEITIPLPERQQQRGRRVQIQSGAGQPRQRGSAEQIGRDGGHTPERDATA
jgi:HSP20 family protein